MPSSPNQQEQIDIRILRLIGLEDVFDLDYGTYLSLLKEVMVKGRMTKTSIPTEEIELVTKEFKRVRSKKDKGRFKVKSKKISASKLTGGSVAAIAGSVKALAPSMGSSLVAVSKKTTGGGESDSDPLTEIKESLDRIAGLLIQQLANLKATGEKERRAAENKRREARETRLEKGFAAVTKVAKKIVAPVKSILDKIINFFVTIFLGRAVIKLLDWFGDPANAKKVSAIFRFLGDQWPKLIAAYLLFGNSLGRFVTRLSVRLLRAIATFALRNPKLAGAIGGIALGGFLVDYLSKNNPFQISERDEDADRTVTEFNQGGFVSGQSGIDKIPAMLTDGEFVMSRGAVQQFGLDTLLAMNAAGGGTNRPRVVSGVSFAQGGGPIGTRNSFLDNKRERATQAGMFSTRIGRGVLDNIGYGSGDFMFKGLPAGVEYNPAFSGAGDKLFGLNPQGKKLTDLFGLRGAFGALADTQYFTPDLGTAMKYAGGGGSIVAMPRTSGFSSFKNPLGSNIMRGFDPSKGIEQLVRTSDSVASAAAGTTRVMNMNNPALQRMATQGLRAGAPLARRLGRFIPFLGTGLAAADIADRTARGDELGAALGGISAIPGPVGMVGAGAQIIYDVSRAFPTSRIRGRSGAKRAMMSQQKPAMRFAGGPAPSSPNRSYAVPPPIQNKTNVRYVNTPSGSSGGGYGSGAVSTREIPTFSAVIADSRRRSKAAQLGIG
tara:strand:+ start:811 stop:2964 length:2154 start_codon:yes stop_codon:yes gene_type:complete